MLKNLPDGVRTRTLDAVRNGTGKVELRTRLESNETELVLISATEASHAIRHRYLMKYPATRQCPSTSRVGVIVSIAAGRLANDV